MCDLLQLIDDFHPATFNYLLGKNILVAPIHTNSSSVSVTFPEGSSWVDWWNHSNVFTAKSSQTFNNVPLEDYPVFFRNGNSISMLYCSLGSTHYFPKSRNISAAVTPQALFSLCV